MTISDNLLKNFSSMFVDTSEESKIQNKLYGTVTIGADGAFVKLDGSEELTPVVLGVNALTGNRVEVEIKDHTATVVSNITWPADNVQSGIDIPSEALVIETAFIDNLFSNNAYISSLTSDSISSKMVTARTINAGFIRATREEVLELSANEIYAKTVATSILNADKADIDNLTAKIVTTDVINAKNASLGYAKVNYIKADDGYAVHLRIDDADTGKLKADIALIKEAVISDGHVTGFLDAVKINANDITVGSLTVDRLLIKDGDKYRMVSGFDEDGKPLATTVDASILTDRTVTADHIVSHSITANEMTVENIVGAHGWINLAQGTFDYGALKWDGSKLTINGYATSDSVSGLSSTVLSMSSLIFYPNKTTINGGNIETATIKAAQIDVDDLFTRQILVKSGGSIQISAPSENAGVLSVEGNNQQTYLNTTNVHSYDGNAKGYNFFLGDYLYCRDRYTNRYINLSPIYGLQFSRNGVSTYYGTNYFDIKDDSNNTIARLDSYSSESSGINSSSTKIVTGKAIYDYIANRFDSAVSSNAAISKGNTHTFMINTGRNVKGIMNVSVTNGSGGIGESWCSVWKYYVVDSTKIYIYVRNNNSGDVNVRVECVYMYQ